MPQRNVEFEVFVFRQEAQASEETLNTFHARLKQLSKNCSFHDVDREIKSRIIQEWPLNKVQEKGLSESNITVAEAISSLMLRHMASELCSRTRWSRQTCGIRISDSSSSWEELCPNQARRLCNCTWGQKVP